MIHVASVHEYVAADKTFKTVAGSGGVIARRRTELEGTLRDELGAQHLGRLAWRDKSRRSPVAAAPGCRFAFWRRCAAASPPRRRWPRVEGELRPGAQALVVPGAAQARPGRGAAPAAGQAARRRRGRCAAVHRARPVLARWRCALRAVHAGRPGGRGRQAQPGHARPRPASSMPACAASCASATRWSPPPTREPVARVEPPALVDRAAEARPSGATGSRSCAADNTQPPMTLRVNARKTTPAAYPACAGSGQYAGASPVGEHGLHAGAAAAGPGDLPGFAEGEVSVQDAAAQLAAPLLLDGLAAAARRCACWTPAPRPAARPPTCSNWRDAEVTALDIDAARCAAHRRERCAGSACRPQVRRRRRGAAAALVGRPALRRASCSTRRAPPRASCGATRTCAGCAARATSRSWRCSRRSCWQPCGRCCGRADGLLYCTCSVFRAEGEAPDRCVSCAQQRRPFCGPRRAICCRKAGAKARGVPDNRQGDHDGFFYALLEKQRC